MSENITRKSFLTGTAALGALGLAACSSGGGAAGGSDAAAAPTYEGLPDPSEYPLEPDGADVAALWTSEKVRDGWFRYTNPDGGATLGVMDEAKIIQVAGLAFKDMNGDGKLDLYEDWRQPAEVRSEALAAMMDPATEIGPLLFHGGTQSDQTSTDTSNFDLVEKGSRAGVSRLAANPDSYASSVAWINEVQKVCEASKYGIPYMNSSDPYSLFNVPSSIGLAATMDKDIWRKAGMWQARAWRSTGVSIELGPQVDVYSNPIGTRTSGSVCEDPAINRDFTKAFGGGMQSTWGDDEATEDLGWGKDSVAVMLKHFVGEGSNEGGRDDHSDMGKWDVFPGSNFEAHLIPFLDGGMNLDSSTGQMAAVMPCYGIAYDPNDPEALGEHVGSAYSERNMNILRSTGWDGMLCTDWMILTGIAHGVKNLTEPERLAKMYKNTISQYGGGFEPEMAAEVYGMLVEELGEEEAAALYRDAARRIFNVLNRLNMFDNPFCDREIAKAVFENQAAWDFGMDAATKSIIMLKNKDGVISEAGLDGKVYVPANFNTPSPGFFGPNPASVDPGFTAIDGWDVVADAIGEASGEAGDDGNPTWQESDITRLTKEELADVKYAVLKISNPYDAYQGVDGGAKFANVIMGIPAEKEAEYKPLSLQYRPFTADGDYVREHSLNPEDEFGVLEDRSVKGQSTYATNENDLDLVIAVREALPEDAKLILCIDADRPMCFHEVEPYADVILLGFAGIVDAAYANIINGTAEPSGLLPFQMPKDMETVMTQLEDVPRDMDCYVDADGNTYDFCFGLNWGGVIDDERVATYKVAPLTKPETSYSA